MFSKIIIARPRLHSMQRGKNLVSWLLLEIANVERRRPRP